MTKDNGGAAFPFSPSDKSTSHMATNGMSLRDWFAGQALAGIMAGEGASALDGNALAKLIHEAEARVWHEAAKEARECDYPWASPTNEQADACDQMAERIADWLDSRAEAAAAIRQGDTP